MARRASQTAYSGIINSVACEVFLMASKDQIRTQGHNRLWLQVGEASPVNPTVLSSVGTQHLGLSGLSNPLRGSIDRIRILDPRNAKQYKTVGTSEGPAAFATATLLIREVHAAVVKLLSEQCAFNLYIASGKCTNLSNWSSGWSDYVRILSGCETMNVNNGDQVPFDSDDVIEDSLELTITGGVYDVGGLVFGEQAATTVSVEMLDITYGDSAQCGDCGPANDGTKFIYGLSTTGVSPAGVVYSVDGGATWTALAITGIGAAEVPTAIRVVGQYLVVFSKLGGGATLSSHYITPLNPKTGVPSSTWTEVTTGYVATFTANDVVVVSPSEIYIAASGGYVYGSSDIASGVTVLTAGDATVEDLKRIHGTDDGVIVAAGNNGVVLKSLTRGATWATTVTFPVVATLTGVNVLSADRYWATSSAGNAYYTLDGGETWALKAFAGSGAGSIADIRFATNEVGYIAHTTAAPIGRVLATIDGGNTWNNTASRIVNMPTNLRINRLAVPLAANLTVLANNVAGAGLDAGTDGLILLGKANMR